MDLQVAAAIEPKLWKTFRFRGQQTEGSNPFSRKMFRFG